MTQQFEFVFNFGGKRYALTAGALDRARKTRHVFLPADAGMLLEITGSDESGNPVAFKEVHFNSMKRQIDFIKLLKIPHAQSIA